MSYTAIGSGSITLNVVSAEEQKNLQEALMNRYDRLRTADLAQCGDDMAYQIEREYQELTQAMLKYNDPFWWLTVVFKEAGFTEVERNPNDVALSIELSYYNNYYEDMILELLNTLVPFTAEGLFPTAVKKVIYGAMFLPAGNGLSGAAASAMMNRGLSSRRASRIWSA